MPRDMSTQPNIEAYIATFPEPMQKILQKIREVIHVAAPDATEAIKYGIPTFILNGNLVHFGGYKHHIGFYPAPTGIEAFKEELSVYGSSKGTIKFPIDKPIPFDLITKVVKFRIEENLKNSRLKSPKKYI